MSISTVTTESEQTLKEALRELESPQGRVQVGVQKLVRAARMLGEDDVAMWCEIQLGNEKYVGPLRSGLANDSLEYVLLDQRITVEMLKLRDKQATNADTNFTTNAGMKEPLAKNKTEGSSSTQGARKTDNRSGGDWDKKVKQGEMYVQTLTALGLKEEIHYTREERSIKKDKAGGGYKNIGTIEDILTSLLKNKLGNDGTHYQNNLSEHINYVRRVAHEKAARLYNKVLFSNTPQTSLDILREEVENRLLDLAPEATEKLMIAFRAVASDHPEEWSHALTSCRRFLESLADTLYPPTDDETHGRKLGQSQYINRLWAFMDASIVSESNKELAKAHVDYLGSYLERAHKVGHKGVHADLSRTEAIKAVFHTYLLVADILDYLNSQTPRKSGRLNIHTATLDELESVLEVNRAVAKEIIKLRVELGIVHPSHLVRIKGIGPKTRSIAEKVLSFEPAK